MKFQASIYLVDRWRAKQQQRGRGWNPHKLTKRSALCLSPNRLAFLFRPYQLGGSFLGISSYSYIFLQSALINVSRTSFYEMLNYQRSPTHSLPTQVEKLSRPVTLTSPQPCPTVNRLLLGLRYQLSWLLDCVQQS